MTKNLVGFNEDDDQAAKEQCLIETQFNVYLEHSVISVLPAGPEYGDTIVEIRETDYHDRLDEPSVRLHLEYEKAELVAKAILKQCALIRKSLKPTDATNQTSLPIS